MSISSDVLESAGFTPVVGMGATEGIGSDSYPYTIIEVRRNGKELVLQGDSYHRTDKNGFSENQTYLYSPNPDGRIVVVTLRKNGKYKRKGSDMSSSYRYSFGHRRAYQDPSF